MADDEDILGRRAADKHPGPEAVGFILAQLARDIAEIKADLKEGFGGLRQELGQQEKRVSALERFRERVEERDKALAKAEGQLTVRLPVLALILTLMAIGIGVLTAVLQSS